MSLRICILEADELHPTMQPSYQGFGQMFIRLLGSQSRAACFEVYNVMHGEYPGEQEDFDAYLVTGSKADAFGAEDWIERLRQYLLQRYQAGDVLLGICFGHQILALVLGGQTERAEQGWGAGVHRYRMLAAPVDQLEVPSHLHMLISHRDQVTRLPAGAQLLASSDFCPNAAFSLEGRVLCFQGHPEFTHDFSRALLQIRQGIYTPEFYARCMESLQQAHDGQQVGHWMLEFVASARAKRQAKAPSAELAPAL